MYTTSQSSDVLNNSDNTLWLAKYTNESSQWWEDSKELENLLRNSWFGEHWIQAKFRIPPAQRSISSLLVNKDSGEQGMAELWESWSWSKKFQIIFRQWKGSKLSYAKKPCLLPGRKDGSMPRYNWATERWSPQSPQTIWDVLLFPVYIEHTTDTVPKMPAEKTRKLSGFSIYTNISRFWGCLYCMWLL